MGEPYVAPPPVSAETAAAAAEAVDAARRKGVDGLLADQLAPQMGFGFDVETVAAAKPPGLADKFLVPPFTVLDTRAGYWQERRRAWLSLGIRSEKGRDDNLLNFSDAVRGGPGYAVKRELAAELEREPTKEEVAARLATSGSAGPLASGTSIFDAVLCEIAYRWFSGEGARVLDPFAGGSVRGVVAAALGREYAGVELRPEQIADNEAQALDLFGPGSAFDFGRNVTMPVWIERDARDIETLRLPPVDLVFTCPPYADLEVYSDDPRDLSTMQYVNFRQALLKVMNQSAAVLKPNRFAVWVVGEARGKDGNLYGIVPDTIRAARHVGLKFYNHAILLNATGTAALRAQRIFNASRKVVPVHQYVLVFLKGDAKLAAKACGDANLDMGETP